MHIFNAFQMVGSFVAWPFLIAWLNNAQFQGHQFAFFSACAFYAVGFCFMVGAVASALSNWGE